MHQNASACLTFKFRFFYGYRTQNHTFYNVLNMQVVIFCLLLCTWLSRLGLDVMCECRLVCNYAWHCVFRIWYSSTDCCHWIVRDENLQKSTRPLKTVSVRHATWKKLTFDCCCDRAFGHRDRRNCTFTAANDSRKYFSPTRCNNDVSFRWLYAEMTLYCTHFIETQIKLWRIHTCILNNKLQLWLNGSHDPYKVTRIFTP